MARNRTKDHHRESSTPTSKTTANQPTTGARCIDTKITTASSRTTATSEMAANGAYCSAAW